MRWNGSAGGVPCLCLRVGVPTRDLLFRDGLGEARLEFAASDRAEDFGLFRGPIQDGGEGCLGLASGLAG